MEIKTKFYVGNEIWCIRTATDVVGSCIHCGAPIEGEISAVHDNGFVDTVSYIQGQISYTARVGFFSFQCKEENAFVTKEEAQAECDRRNKKGEG